MDDYKERVRAALEKNAKRNMPKPPRKTKNQTPEKDVERECLTYLRSIGCDVCVVESKATYTQGGFYRSQTVKSGFSDIVGCDPNGIYLAIELKAPKRRATLKPHQREFLVEKIKRGAFGVCVDSADLLRDLYQKWNCIAGEPAKKFLLDQLPNDKTLDDSPLFD